MTSEADRERCSCYYVSEHTGAEPDAYVREHLEEVRVDSDNWTIEYRCPLYGKRWLLDQPWGEMHGGGLHRTACALSTRCGETYVSHSRPSKPFCRAIPRHGGPLQ